MSYNTMKFAWPVAQPCRGHDVSDQVATITLARPEAANSLSLEMSEELHAVATHCDSNPNIRAVILTAEGKMFCAGGDVVDLHLAALPRDAAVARFTRMDAPLIVAVNGTAAGAGMSLSLIGDIVFAAQSAKFTMAYSKIGFSPDGSSTFFLPRLVGMRKAKELALLNPVLSADEACDLGLVTEVVADVARALGSRRRRRTYGQGAGLRGEARQGSDEGAWRNQASVRGFAEYDARDADGI